MPSIMCARHVSVGNREVIVGMCQRWCVDVVAEGVNGCLSIVGQYVVPDMIRQR